MFSLEDLKTEWKAQQQPSSINPAYTEAELKTMYASRMKKNKGVAIQYFWAAFVFHMLTYGLLSHVVIRTWMQTEMYYSLAGILIFIPFTSFLVTKFWKLALMRVSSGNASDIATHVSDQYQVLDSFYTFKKRYELFLIPVASLLGVVLVFDLFVPGGITAHVVGAAITFGITLLSCALAIWNENRKHFSEPLRQYKLMYTELTSDMAAGSRT